MLAQQEKVAWADGLAFIAPIHFCSFPAILKGWIDRVWTLDFAYGLTSGGWHGDVNGRIPLLHQHRCRAIRPGRLIISGSLTAAGLWSSVPRLTGAPPGTASLA